MKKRDFNKTKTEFFQSHFKRKIKIGAETKRIQCFFCNFKKWRANKKYLKQ
jgi:hypothetical protein